ncbi:MAG: hypothetical protein AAGA84_10330 [Pseudomonadota bacterium]
MQSRISLLVLTMLASAVLTLHSPRAESGQELMQYTGERNATSRSFRARGPWLLTWRINSDYPEQAGVSVDLVDAKTGVFLKQVLRRGTLGWGRRDAVSGGYKLFRDEGEFRFEISATLARYELKVEQLTAAEADALVPAGGD